jgi:hypothetical protein
MNLRLRRGGLAFGGVVRSVSMGKELLELVDKD